MRTRLVGSVVAAVLAVAGVMVLALLAFVYSGEYNVAATRPHWGPMRWMLTTTMEHSVRDHASGIQVPPLADSALFRTGFHHFDEMCVTCHGAPGVERSEIGKGLMPEPPDLSEEVGEWSPAELFWIVKHGIKMSGMPAFGPTHDDREIWGVVAVLQRLPEMSPEEYRSLRGPGAARGGQAGPGGDDGHQHSH